MGNRGRLDTHNRQVMGHRTQTDGRQRRSGEFKFGFTHGLNYSNGFFMIPCVLAYKHPCENHGAACL